MAYSNLFLTNRDKTTVTEFASGPMILFEDGDGMRTAIGLPMCFDVVTAREIAKLFNKGLSGARTTFAAQMAMEKTDA